MVFSKDILDAINLLLVKKWPEWDVNRGFLPKDFQRPSFYIELVKESRRPGNATLLHVIGYYTVVVFVPMDDYGVMKADELLQLQSDVMELFAGEKLKVGGRSLNVTASAGGMNEGEAYVDIQVDYYRPRSAAPDDTPLMGEVTTAVKIMERNDQ